MNTTNILFSYNTFIRDIPPLTPYQVDLAIFYYLTCLPSVQLVFPHNQHLKCSHMRYQGTYTYHNWYTLLNSPCAAEAINNTPTQGGGPCPVYASSVQRLTSFYAVIQIIHSDSTGRFKRLRLDAAKGILVCVKRELCEWLGQIWQSQKLHSGLTYI